MAEYVREVHPPIKDLDKYWYDDNAFKTAFLNSLSALFPGGELFFLRAITPFVKEFPEFKEDLDKFIYEEGQHTKGHRLLNRGIDDLYLNSLLQDMELEVDRLLKKLSSKLSPEANLIVTEALEHITFNLCESILERQYEVDTARSDALALYLYHCNEETSDHHSSIVRKICKKVLNRSIKRKKIFYSFLRKHSITPISLILISVLLYQIKVTQDVNGDIRIKETIKGIKDLFGFDGWVRHGIMQSIKTWK